MNPLNKRESGQALILVLVLLLIGGLMLVPLLNFVGTSVKVSQVYHQKTDELYAADAGVEDALWKIIKHDPSLDALSPGDSHVYTMTDSQQVNGLPVNIKVTKLSLVEGLISGEDYKEDSSHEGWGDFEAPEGQVIRDYDQGWVEYTCDVAFRYEGVGNRQLVTIGTFFALFPGNKNLIEGPYDIAYIPVMKSDDLEDGSPEIKVASGGFSFIWRWGETPPRGPIFGNDDTGAVSFKFKIHDPDWSYSDCFLWATFKEQDVSYVTNAPGLYKWQVEATAGDTAVSSVVMEDIGALSILIWEIRAL